MKAVMTMGVALMAAMLLLSGHTIAQDKPEFDMGKMQMVFLTVAPDWKPKDARQLEQILRRR